MTQTEEIKQKVDIVDLVSEQVPLKASGRNFKANCPFHNERTPSFYVFPDRQSWHCFGACAAGGDVFTFVMRRYGAQFGEALKTLADRAGVTLAPPKASRERSDRMVRMKELNRDAALFYHETLLKSDEAAGARQYLQTRGLLPETIEDFRLGYSPEGVGLLQRRLQGHGYTEPELHAAGLVRQRDDGSGSFAFFRGRLMIPIQDARSDYLGFGARALDSSNPKYINSPQSELFDKGSILYGLHRSAEGIKHEGMAVIVEGYMDVLTAHQNGFTNVVASMGTALTERQVASLKRLVGNFVLALDPDAAGEEATLRSLESSWRIMDRPSGQAVSSARLTGPDATRELTLRVMDLPRGQDPDLLIREQPDTWRELIGSATDVIDYVFQAAAARFDIATTRGKDSLTQRLAPFIHNAPNIFEQNERIKKLAQVLKEEENVIRVAVGGPKRLGSRRGGRRERPEQGPAQLAKAVHDPMEAWYVATLLRYPEHLGIASPLSPEHFSEAHTQEIFRFLSAGRHVEELKEELDPELYHQVDALLEYPLPAANYADREHGLKECNGRFVTRLTNLKVEALSEQYAAGMISMEQGSILAEELKAQRVAVDRGE